MEITRWSIRDNFDTANKLLCNTSQLVSPEPKKIDENEETTLIDKKADTFCDSKATEQILQKVRFTNYFYCVSISKTSVLNVTSINSQTTEALYFLNMKIIKN